VLPSAANPKTVPAIGDLQILDASQFRWRIAYGVSVSQGVKGSRVVADMASPEVVKRNPAHPWFGNPFEAVTGSHASRGGHLVKFVAIRTPKKALSEHRGEA